MSENTDVSSGKMPSISSPDWEQAQGLIGKILAAAQPGAVFGQPVTAGDYTLITAAEVFAGGGFGFGAGVGPAKTSRPVEGIGGQTPQEGRQEVITGGSGGGGGGGSKGRPVAVIVIGPEGVKVKPVFDITRLLIAGITARAAMAIAFRRMHRASKQ